MPNCQHKTLDMQGGKEEREGRKKHKPQLIFQFQHPLLRPLPLPFILLLPRFQPCLILLHPRLPFLISRSRLLVYVRNLFFT